jgi:secondary thiamine-phosphate synthase enzyme
VHYLGVSPEYLADTPKAYLIPELGLELLSTTYHRFQKQLLLPSKSRGSYLITDTIVKELPEIKDYKIGILHLFIQHTSCALSLNENWDEDVRADMSDSLDRIVPEDQKGGLYRHDAEGSDDMPVRRSFD